MGFFNFFSKKEGKDKGEDKKLPEVPLTSGQEIFKFLKSVPHLHIAVTLGIVDSKEPFDLINLERSNFLVNLGPDKVRIVQMVKVRDGVKELFLGMGSGSRHMETTGELLRKFYRTHDIQEFVNFGRLYDEGPYLFYPKSWTKDDAVQYRERNILNEIPIETYLTGQDPDTRKVMDFGSPDNQFVMAGVGVLTTTLQDNLVNFNFNGVGSDFRASTSKYWLKEFRTLLKDIESPYTFNFQHEGKDIE